jgi:nucleotide-binding universal stress UspA family protein
VRGAARQALIEASKGARMLVVGRRGHGRFGGLLIGSVSSACVAHAHCPVVVVHVPEPDKTN